MDSNYLVQRRINAQKKYRKKITLVIALSAILLVLIIVGLVKVIMDEKGENGNINNETQISEQVTPGVNSATDEEQQQTEENDIPEPTATPTVTPTPVPKKKVAVDAGHGGEDDLGSSRPKEGLYEKDATLAISLFLKQELEDAGYAVYMIRESDIDVDKRDRVTLAKENGADIYVSIHLNSLEKDSDDTRGAETWYSDLHDNNSNVLAQYVVDELTSVIDTRNRGIKLSNNLIVLKYNELPACLVECGFMSSATERAKLFDSEYQKKIAEGIANGIEKFLPLEEGQ